MRLCAFEDGGAGCLEPLTLTRPAFDLRCGTSTLLDKHRRFFNPTEVTALVRPFMADWCRYLHPNFLVNDSACVRGGETVIVNARWLPPPGPCLNSTTPRVAVIGQQVAYVVVPPGNFAPDNPLSLTQALDAWNGSLPRTPVGGCMIDYPWDLIERNAEAIHQDFHTRPSTDPSNWGTTRPLLIGPANRLVVDASACIEPLAVADTTYGPVLIDRGAVVQAFSRLEGPCYIGPDSRILGAKVRGSTIGPCCRVAGEIETSILHGYSNKCHDGFLGHSYVGEWVNLAAGTQVSDLRNDYAPISVTIAGTPVNTSLLKVGAFLGDHTKTGLNTLLNTGTVAGVFSHLLPSGTLLPKHIPSFCAHWHGQLQERTDVWELFATAAAVMNRRGCAWTQGHIDFFLSLYDALAVQRHRVLQNAVKRQRRVV
jgi:UDP-N-acetylglucosamine diphosphorylase/glucosamine-1-phosphate N-acetyltransferase